MGQSVAVSGGPYVGTVITERDTHYLCSNPSRKTAVADGVASHRVAHSQSSSVPEKLSHTNRPHREEPSVRSYTEKQSFMELQRV